VNSQPVTNTDEESDLVSQPASLSSQ